MRAMITEVFGMANMKPNFDNYSIDSTTEFFAIEPNAQSVFIITPQSLNNSLIVARKEMTFRVFEGEENMIAVYLIALDDSSNHNAVDFIKYASTMLAKTTSLP